MFQSLFSQTTFATNWFNGIGAVVRNRFNPCFRRRLLQRMDLVDCRKGMDVSILVFVDDFCNDVLHKKLQNIVIEFQSLFSQTTFATIAMIMIVVWPNNSFNPCFRRRLLQRFGRGAFSASLYLFQSLFSQTTFATTGEITFTPAEDLCFNPCFRRRLLQRG